MTLRLCFVLMSCVALLGIAFPEQVSAQFGGGLRGGGHFGGGGWYPGHSASGSHAVGGSASAFAYSSASFGYQNPFDSHTSLDLGVPSQKGKPILSRPCDPMMTTRREAELLAILARENPFDWSLETPLSKVAEAISTLAPMRIDERALEEIGLDKDLRVVDRARHTVTKAMEKGKETAKWWTAKSSRAKTGTRRPLSAVLDAMLRDMDLTLEIRAGEFIITTLEEAEGSGQTRIYDVRPIVRSKHAGDMGHREFDSLMNLIQSTVVPDTWEALGGMSTMTVYSVHGHDWMIITAPTTVHLRTQTLLDELNR
ncbi:MAG: hypothetical protein AAFU85_10600 [Planctomycetota bacterium]